MLKHNKIAVYGSLRKGAVSEDLMDGCKHLTRDKIVGRLYDLGWYPGAKLGFDGNDDELSIVVDVFELPTDDKVRKAVLEQLDRYEGFEPTSPSNSLFIPRTALLEDMNEECIVYEYNNTVSKRQLVKTGDWLNKNG